MMVVSQLAWAEPGSVPCTSERRWEDYSSITVSIEGADVGDAIARAKPMKVETHVYDDGSLVIADDEDHPRVEVVWLSRPEDPVALGNVATAPMELGEVSMLYELPMAVMRQQFRGPCDLRPGIHYPVASGPVEDAVSGLFELDGDAVRFSLRERRGRELFSYSGSIRYGPSRGKIPASLPIAGWTVFHGSVAAAENGHLSTFATLGELQDRLSRPR